MSKTPPPDQLRPQTPPTPLHGSRHDFYEPYSPRRSARIHNSNTYQRSAARETGMAQQTPSRASSKQAPRRNETNHRNGASSNDNTRMAAREDADPREASFAKKRTALRRTSSQTWSPPDSPTSPARKSARKVRDSTDTGRAALGGMNRGPLFSSRRLAEEPGNDSRLSHAEPPKGFMLPTPKKTPAHERHYPAESVVKTKGRALFQDELAAQDLSLPTPIKSVRRAPRRDRALDLMEDFGAEPKSKNITFFTDSRDRVPEVDMSEDNPFSKKGKKVRREAKAQVPESREHGLGPEIDEAVAKGEGMVYVFRGRKMFRRFNDDDNPAANNPRSDPLDETDDVRRQAGPAASQHFTRSSIQPRLLFPTTSDSEEATTDVDETIQNGYDFAVDREVNGVHDSPMGSPSRSPAAAALKRKTPARSTRASAPPTSRKTPRHHESGGAAAAAESDSSVRDLHRFKRSKSRITSQHFKRPGSPLEKASQDTDESTSGKRAKRTANDMPL